MKKIILSILVLILLTGCGIFDLNGFITPDDEEFITLVKELDTPQKISDYMIENFDYKAYDFTTLSPYELFLYKKGDCDIFAIFGQYIAYCHSYKTFTIHIFDSSFYSHYVAVYDEDIYYSITDNQYYYFGFENFKEIVEDVCRRRFKVWTKYIVYDYWNNVEEEIYNN